MRPTVVLYSRLDPPSVTEILRGHIDPERRTLFSISGYKGDRPILGEVNEKTFRLQKRRYSRNDFAGHFYGRTEPMSEGTRIEGYFDAPLWARVFMRVWLGFAVLIGGIGFVATLLSLFTGEHIAGDTWVGLVVPPALVLFGTVLPKLGRSMGRGDRRFILEFLRQTLGARLDDMEASVR